MNEKIKEIYQGCIQENRENDTVSKEIQEQIMLLLKDEKQKMGWKEFEEYRDKIYLVSAISREGGFINGFKYAVMLMAECYADQNNITLKLL